MIFAALALIEAAWPGVSLPAFVDSGGRQLPADSGFRPVFFNVAICQSPRVWRNMDISPAHQAPVPIAPSCTRSSTIGPDA